MRVYQIKNIMARVGINCYVGDVTKLAKELKWSEIETRNAVGAWQTANNFIEIPKAKELGEFINRLRKEESMKGTAEMSPRQKMINSYDPLVLQDRLNYMPEIFIDALIKTNQNYVIILKERIEREKDSVRQQEMIDEVNAINNDIWKNNWGSLAKRVRIDNVIRDMKVVLQERSQPGWTKDKYIRDNHTKMLEHFDALFEESLPLIEKTVHLRIQPKRNIQEEESARQETDEMINGDDDLGIRADNNDFLFYRIREIELRSTLSQKIRDFIRGIPRLYPNGKPIKDDIGKTKFLNEGYVYKVLQNGLSWMKTPDDFAVKKPDGGYRFPALERLMEQKDEYRWIKPLMVQLNMHPELIPQFYTGFRQEFIPQRMMSITKEGLFLPTPLNNSNLTTRSMDIINRNYNLGIDTKDTIWRANRQIKEKKITELDNLRKEAARLTDEIWREIQNRNRNAQKELADQILPIALKIFRMVGVNPNENQIRMWLERARFADIDNLNSALGAAGEIADVAKSMKKGDNLVFLAQDHYRNLVELIAKVDENDRVASYYKGGKMYQSYCLPSYTDTFLKRLRDPETRKQILEELKQDRFLYDSKKGKWKNSILRRIAEHPKDEPFYRGFMESVMMNFINDRSYEEWTEADMINGFIAFYFSNRYNENTDEQFGWYNFPIMSDVKTAQFIRLPRYVGDVYETMEQQMLPLFRDLVYQELNRMNRVETRKAEKATPVQSYDERGTEFCFFPELNGIFVQVTDGNGNPVQKPFKEAALDYVEENDKASLDRMIYTVIQDLLNAETARILEKAKESGLKKILIQNGILDDPENEERKGLLYLKNFEQAVKEYVWNSIYATSQIIQLMTTDLAFYKNDQDFQKRAKQFYGSGRKLFTNSKYGKEYDTTIILKDFIRPSSTYAQIRKTFLDGVKKGLLSEEEAESFISKFQDIDITDGQGYRTLESMRSILDMAGELTPELEQTINRIINEENTPQDTRRFMQVIKPFFFSNIMESDGIGGKLRTPVQQKNSEAVLLAIYDALGGPKTPSNVKGLNRFMKDHNIDAAQFESAVKVGSKGAIDLNWSEKKFTKVKEEMGLDPDLDRNRFTDKLLQEVKDGKMTQDEYNDIMERMIPDEEEVYDTLSKYCLDEQGNLKEDTVRRNPFDDYVIQQPSPEHLMDTDASFGVQFRNLVPANLPEGTYIVNGKEYDAKGIRKHFEMLVNEGMLEDFENLKKKVRNIENLQKFIKQTIWGNPKYSRSFTSAFDLIDWKDNVTDMIEKRFALPIWTPSIVNRTESLLTSLFRNNITKRKENGGIATLKSNFGTGYDDLKIVFNEDGGIDYAECYLPAWTAKFFDKEFIGEDGLPDIDKIPEELKTFFGYRMPTEGKMSIARLKVKGFLTPEEGTSLILPADFVTITGEDFDVDKRFLTFPEFETIRKYDIKKAWDTFYRENPEIEQQIEQEERNRYQQAIDLTKENNKDNKDFNPENLPTFEEWLPLLYEDMERNGEKRYDLVKGTKERFNGWFKENNGRFLLNTELKKIEYDPAKEESGETQDPRAVWNELLDTAAAILSNKEVAIQNLHPSNFDSLKKMDRIVNIITDKKVMDELVANGIFEKDLGSDWNNLFNMSLRYLDGLLEKHKTQTNSLYLTTFMENHRRNMVADRLIGMYANNLVQQAKYQDSGLRIKLNSNIDITIDGRVLDRLDKVKDGDELISERGSSFSAASVDAVKDPVLDALRQNIKTASITNTMIRMGFTIPEITLLLNQPSIRSLASIQGNFSTFIRMEYSHTRRNMVEDYGREKTQELEKDLSITKEDLMKRLTNRKDMSNDDIRFLDFKVLNIMRQISYISDDLRPINKVSRADSMNGAIPITIAGTDNMLHITDMLHTRKSSIRGKENIIKNGLLEKNGQEATRKELKESFMQSAVPMAQCAYTLGIESFNHLMSDYILGSVPNIRAMKEYLYIDSETGDISDELLKKFYVDMVTFALTDTDYFGNDGTKTFEEKRREALEDFPKRLAEIIESNPAIAKLNIIQNISLSNGMIILENAKNLTQEGRDILTKDLDNLLYMNDPQAREVAEGLFKYEFYKNRFQFTATCINTLFSPLYYQMIPEVYNALQNVPKSFQSFTGFSETFLNQFYIKNGHAFLPMYSLDDFVSEEEQKRIARQNQSTEQTGTDKVKDEATKLSLSELAEAELTRPSDQEISEFMDSMKNILIKNMSPELVFEDFVRLFEEQLGNKFSPEIRNIFYKNYIDTYIDSIYNDIGEEEEQEQKPDRYPDKFTVDVERVERKEVINDPIMVRIIVGDYIYLGKLDPSGKTVTYHKSASVSEIDYNAKEAKGTPAYHNPEDESDLSPLDAILKNREQESKDEEESPFKKALRERENRTPASNNIEDNPKRTFSMTIGITKESSESSESIDSLGDLTPLTQKPEETITKEEIEDNKSREGEEESPTIYESEEDFLEKVFKGVVIRLGYSLKDMTEEDIKTIKENMKATYKYLRDNPQDTERLINEAGETQNSLRYFINEMNKIDYNLNNNGLEQPLCKI